MALADSLCFGQAHSHTHGLHPHVILKCAQDFLIFIYYLDHVAPSSWHAPLLIRSHSSLVQIPFLLETVLDHPHSHLSELWMALMLLCIAVCQFIIHWLVTLLVQLWAVTSLSYICSLSLQISCLKSLRTQRTSLAFFFCPFQCLAHLS